MGPSTEVIPFVSRLKIEGAKRVYDLGCGAGRHTVYLAREGFEVYASDIAPDGLEETRKRLKEENLRAEVVPSDLSAIPYPDSFFDAVVAVRVVYHGVRDDVEACLGEVHRTLRGGGLFFVSFKSTQADDYGKGRRIDGNTFVKVGGIEDGIPHYFIDRTELERLMEKFELLQIDHEEEWVVHESGNNTRDAHWIVCARRL